MKNLWSTLVLAVGIVSQTQMASASCGTFEVSKGDVKVQSADGKIVAAALGSKICSGETVIAADQARAKIHMEDGNELNISPNSKIVIETYQYDVATNKKKVLLNVLKGKVRATTVRENMYNDKSKDGQANTFQVRTKSAVAGVRGTDFLTGFDPATNKTDIVTFRGKVEVGLPGPAGTILNSVQVAVGQKSEVIAGSMPSVPKSVAPAELTKINIETRNSEAASSGAGAPSSDTKKGSETHSDHAPDSGAVATSPAPVGTSPAVTPASDRSPASPPLSTLPPVTACSMCSNDLPNPTNLPAAPPVLPYAPQVPPLPTSIATNPFVTTAVQNANQRANVHLNLRIGQ